MDEVLAFTSSVNGGMSSRYYVHSNHLFSPASLTNAAGAIVERMQYDAYGKQAITSPTGAVRAKSTVGFDPGFVGYIIDNETGLLHARARQYSPTQGRFIGRDSLKYVDGYNLYMAYFVPNSLDPSGNKLDYDWAGLAQAQLEGWEFDGLVPETLSIKLRWKKWCGWFGLGGKEGNDWLGKVVHGGDSVDSPPARHCEVKEGSPFWDAGLTDMRVKKDANGNRIVVMGFGADFVDDLAKGADPTLCEFRLLIRWVGKKPHRGFKPPDDKEKTWVEDRDKKGGRYGRRPGDPNVEIYQRDSYRGGDVPMNGAGEWEYKIQVIDTLSGRLVAENILTQTVKW